MSDFLFWYSSILFSRLLDLKLKYNHYVNRRVKYGHFGDATERFQQAIEEALLLDEICLKSLEILLNYTSSEISTKLTKIRFR